MGGPDSLQYRRPQPDAILGLTSRGVYIPHVEACKFGQPQPGSERQRLNKVVPKVPSRGAENRSLFTTGQGLGAEVEHGASRPDCRSVGAQVKAESVSEAGLLAT